MREPVPLHEDPSFDEDLRRDLANVRGLPAPSFDFDRGLRTLKASVDRQVPLAGAGHGSARSGIWRIVAGVTILCVGALLVTRRSPSVEPAPAAADVRSSVTPVEDRAPVAERPAQPPDPAPVTSPAALPDAPQLGKPAVRHIASPSATTSPAPPDPAPSAPARHIHEELVHMRELRARVATDPVAALAMADEGQRRFSSGVFTQEREVIAIEAMQRLGQTEAAKWRAARFLDRHPESPFADKVRLLSR